MWQLATERVRAVAQRHEPHSALFDWTRTARMAQLRRLRGHLDAQERVFTTVRGLADFVTSLGPSRGNTCAVRMCFFRGAHFTTERYSGTHLEFIDAESAGSFDEVRQMLEAMPLNIIGSEICQLTVWERADLARFSPGTIYEIRHVFNFNLYNGMPQVSATRACVEDRTAQALADIRQDGKDGQDGQDGQDDRDGQDVPTAQRLPEQAMPVEHVLPRRQEPTQVEGRAAHAAPRKLIDDSKQPELDCLERQPAQADAGSSDKPASSKGTATSPKPAKRQGSDTEPPAKRARTTRQTAASSSSNRTTSPTA